MIRQWFNPVVMLQNYLPERGREDEVVVRTPIVRDDREMGTIVAWVPVSAVQSAMRRIQFALLGAGLLLAAGAASVLPARGSPGEPPVRGDSRRCRPLCSRRPGIQTRRQRFRRNDRAGRHLNQMASQLQERLQTIVRQTSEQQVVLASMVEGVLAIDARQRVITINQAAAELVGNTLTNPLGRNLHEVVRNPDLRRFADRVLASNKSIEDDVVLHGDPDRVLQIRGTALPINIIAKGPAP